MPGIDYEISWVEGVPVVSAPAELDITTVNELVRVIRSCTGPAHTTLVVDMSETTFCDSAGVSGLVQAHKRAVAAGGEVRLVIGGASVMRLLAIIGVDRVMPIFTSLEDALEEASAPSPPA
jgi:anti-sigma B factor antagonist